MGKKQMAKLVPTAKKQRRKSTPINFSDADKMELGRSIAALDSKGLERVIVLIHKYQPSLVKDTTTEIEIDINTLSPLFLTELQLHVKSYVKKKKRARERGRDGGPSSKRRKLSAMTETN